MEIEGYRVVVRFDSDIHMFRGEFVGLNGADAYGSFDAFSSMFRCPPSMSGIE